jgi:superfamily II DNA/RNA helicase
MKGTAFLNSSTSQDYLNEMLQKRGYKVVVLNGSMDIEERKAALKEFEESADIMVSTDAGGEGLNLQFCHKVPVVKAGMGETGLKLLYVVYVEVV